MKITKAIHLGFTFTGLICGLCAQQTLAGVNVIVQPQNPTVNVGSNLLFTAQTSTTAGEVLTGYVWKYSSNSLPPYNVIAGATSSSLPLNNIQVTNGGSYFVTVTYNSGASNGLQAVSTATLLTVRDQPRITSQPSPTNVIRATGSNVTFTASAAGGQPLVYQWRDNTVKLADNARITGSTTNAITITDLVTNDSGNYDLIVTNSFGAITSQVATLNVYVPPFINIPLSDLTVITGNPATFTVSAGGSQPLTFQWSKNGNVITNGGRISGATTASLTINNTVTNDNGTYSVSFSNPVGSVTNDPVTLTVLVPPRFTSPTNTSSQQGFPFTYNTVATGTAPITFGADGLPSGLFIDSNTGVISGIPAVNGNYLVTLYATNVAAVTSTNLLIVLITDVPGITSPLLAIGKQGQTFTYTILASNNPTIFSVDTLPLGLNFDPLTGIISGAPIYSGSNMVTIGAANQYGSDTKTLNVGINTAVPAITSALTAKGTENATNFSYTITANNTPTSFGAVGLPVGLTLNTNTGVISGSTFFGGTNQVLISAANAYGTGSNVLSLAIAYGKIQGLAIADVNVVGKPYAKPYVLDFTFTLRDDTNAATDSSLGNAIVRPPEQLKVECFEGDFNNKIQVPINDETAFIVNRLITPTSSAKQLKTVFLMDYSYSMYITPNGFSAMQTAAKSLIAQEPSAAKFAVNIFHSDDTVPQLVTPFTSDRLALNSNIDNILPNFVTNNFGGSRFYDAAMAALANFTANPDEQHYLIIMSDGYDDSSILTTNGTAFSTLPDIIVNAATNTATKVYCVGFGANPNVGVLQYIATNTHGRYYAAANASNLPGQFALLLKDLNSQYLLRWTSLQRAAVPFQPMFKVTLDNVLAEFNTTFMVSPVFTTNTNSMPFVTNSTLTNISLVPNFNPPDWSGNVKQGFLSLVPDADTNLSSVTLRAFYIPRFVRELKMHYRPNYACTPSLLATNPGGFFSGWTLMQTNDGAGGFFLTVASPDTNNTATSLPYGIMGDLINFQFQYKSVPNAQQAFAFFDVDNSIYPLMPPSGQIFTLTNGTLFITNFPPTPAHGTPVPWLFAHGFTNDLDAAELLSPNGNGLMVWQDYIAGLDPNDPNSKFIVGAFSAPTPGQPPVITFNSALGRTYRVESAITLPNWVTLLDNIAGTGALISVSDNRNLSGVNSVFYRVVLSY